MAPRVLVSDKLSPAAITIFKDRGIDVDFQPDLGKDKKALAARIGDYDGLAIRSATKVTPEVISRAKNLKVVGRADIPPDKKFLGIPLYSHILLNRDVPNNDGRARLSAFYSYYLSIIRNHKMVKLLDLK